MVVNNKVLRNSSPPVRTSDRKSDSVSQKDLICVKEKKQSLLFFPKFFPSEKTFLNANIKLNKIGDLKR